MIDADKERILIDTARLGIEAEAFMQSALGQYLMERAAMESESLLIELIETDPEDAKANRYIRHKLKVVDMFREWVSEAVNSGRNASQTIQVMEAESTED